MREDHNSPSQSESYHLFFVHDYYGHLRCESVGEDAPEPEDREIVSVHKANLDKDKVHKANLDKDKVHKANLAAGLIIF